MPRKGQRIKHRKPSAVKPPKPAIVHVDHLAAHPLTRYMHAHFEWMLTHGYSADTVRARRVALRRFIGWCEEESTVRYLGIEVDDALEMAEKTEA